MQWSLACHGTNIGHTDFDVNAQRLSEMALNNVDHTPCNNCDAHTHTHIHTATCHNESAHCMKPTIVRPFVISVLQEAESSMYELK